MTLPGGILPGGVFVLGSSCCLLRVAAQPYLRRDPCSASNGADLSKKRDEGPRDPCSETCGAGLSKKWGEAPGPSKKRVEDPYVVCDKIVTPQYLLLSLPCSP